MLTEQLWGIPTVDPRDVVVRGRTLVRRDGGREIPIRRIFNRVIPDELERTGHPMPFDYRDDLDVEWIGHPAWYFRLSKSAIPWLRHPAVPRTWRLDTIDAPPADPAIAGAEAALLVRGRRHPLRADRRGTGRGAGRPAAVLPRCRSGWPSRR